MRQTTVEKTVADKTAEATPATKVRHAETMVTVTPPQIATAHFLLTGTEYLAVNRMSEKARNDMEAKQAAGSVARSKKTKTAKNFQELFEAAQYRSKEGWPGIHAACIRNAAISACRLVGFKMTLAKLAIFVDADGVDATDGTPLIRIWGAEPVLWTAPVRLPTGVFDLRPRPRWDPGWQLKPRIRFDTEIFSVTDITNLVMRIGMQVGIGEGRPDSKNSAGLQMGLFSTNMLSTGEVLPESKAA